MRTPALSLPLRRSQHPSRLARRTRRIALHCESLESRQLLSVGQTGLAAGVLVTPSVTSAQISIPATVSNSTPSSYVTIDIDFGSFGGLNQIQVIALGVGPLFSPTPGASSGGGSSSLGVLGSSANSSTGSQTGLSFNVGTTANASITPLNPGSTSATTTPSNPVYVVPPPLAPLAIHLSSSTAPATTQSNSTFISNLDELPQITHFGQSDVIDARLLVVDKLDAKTPSSSLIDDIEPFRVITPSAPPAAQPAPQGERAPAPDAANPQALPPITDPNIDAALDFTDARVLTRSRDADTAKTDDGISEQNTSWSLSAIFGAAAIATGGYHLVMREADRVGGRSIPRWQGAERPNKRKSGSPTR